MVISHIISAQREMSKTGDPVEKGSHTIHDVGLIEFAGAVAAAVENVVFGVHTVLGQQLVKTARSARWEPVGRRCRGR